MERWSINESTKVYNVDNWGADLFSINKKGNICVHPSSNSKNAIDLRVLVDDLIKRKIKPPILLRFMDVLQGRIASINRVFRSAIAENDYPAKYQTFYPIKVNQQRQVVEAIASYGKRYNIGLEVGSKPELVAGIAISTGNGLPIICNGYKDAEYIETVLYATKVGYTITIVVEKLFELEKIIELSKKPASSLCWGFGSSFPPREPANGPPPAARMPSLACGCPNSWRPSGCWKRQRCWSALICCTRTSAVRSPRSTRSKPP